MKKAQYACDHAQSAQEREQALILYRGFKSQAKRLRKQRKWEDAKR